MLGKIIAIVGSPASGKTYLTKKLSNYYKFDVIFEEPTNGFPLQIISNLKNQINLFETMVWFRNLHINNYLSAISLTNKGKNVIIDTSFYQNQFYIDLFISNEFEKEMLNNMAGFDFKLINHPACTIYLKANIKNTKKFLMKRKNHNIWENKNWINFILQSIPLANQYMASIEDKIPNLITINRSETDFNNSKDFHNLIIKIDKILVPIK